MNTYPRRILRLPQVKEITGLSRSTIYAFMKEDKFPQNIFLGSRAVGWLESSIEGWIQAQVNNSKEGYCVGGLNA